MYRNLKAEMARNNIKVILIAETINASYNHTRAKINGKYPFTLDEAFAIQRTFFPDLSIAYLFSPDSNIE